MKFEKILCAGILAAGIIFTGCGDNTAENSTVVQAASENLPQFSTVNLSNEPVTNAIFAQKKITVVNIWGTFCPPCIAEMPELGEWAENMPPDAQIIGLICDVENYNDSQTIEDAKKILREANANFVNLLPDEKLKKYLETVYAVPTTIFIDGQGNMIGEPVVGASVKEYKKRVADYLK